MRATASAGTTRHGELDRVLAALQPHAVRARLLAATGADERAPCRVLDAKYSPGRGCSVLYEVGPRLVRGEVRLSAGPAGAASLALSVLPDDPDLAGLPSLLHGDGARAVLLAAAPEASGCALACRTSLVRYRPGRRATVALSGRFRDRAGCLRSLEYVAKLYHDRDKADAVAAEGRRLARSPAVVDGALRVAPVAAYLPDLPAVVWSAVDGVGLDRLLVGGRIAREPEAAVRGAAASLATLHALSEVSDRGRPVGRELERARARSVAVARVAPPLGARLRGLGDGLQALRPVVACAPTVLLHGDCKPSQFLVGPTGVTVLDLDSSGRGDPAADVGTFLATLRQADVRAAVPRCSARGPRPAATRERLGGAFLDAYLRTAAGELTGGGDGLRARTLWHEALALHRKAVRAFARAPLSPLPDALVSAAEGVLAELRRAATC